MKKHKDEPSMGIRALFGCLFFGLIWSGSIMTCNHEQKRIEAHYNSLDSSKRSVERIKELSDSSNKRYRKILPMPKSMQRTQDSIERKWDTNNPDYIGPEPGEMMEYEGYYND
jgi:hypothetical protein